MNELDEAPPARAHRVRRSRAIPMAAAALVLSTAAGAAVVLGAHGGAGLPPAHATSTPPGGGITTPPPSPAADAAIPISTDTTSSPVATPSRAAAPQPTSVPTPARAPVTVAPPAPTPPPPITVNPVYTNLAPNPSCASGTAGWSGDHAMLVAASVPSTTGVQPACQITRASAAQFGIDDFPDLAPGTPAGARFSASAQVSAASPSSVKATVTLAIREISSSGTIVSQWTSTVTLGGIAAFQPVVVAGGPSVNAEDTIDIAIEQNTAGSGDSFYAEAIALSRTG